MIRTEKDVRRWVSKTAEAKGWSVFWVEAASGGTFGLPDLVLVRRGVVAFAELKAGIVSPWPSGGPGEAGGVWKGELRPSQAHTIRRLLAARASVSIFVGKKGSDEVGTVSVRSALDPEVPNFWTPIRPEFFR